MKKPVSQLIAIAAAAVSAGMAEDSFAQIGALFGSDLEGSSRFEINRIANRGLFSAEFGAADAATTDGRFALYSLREDSVYISELFEIKFPEGTVHVLAEFDSANQTVQASYLPWPCLDSSREARCQLSSDEMLWSLIGEQEGDDERDRLRAADRVHAGLAERLHDAVAAGDIETIESILQQGASITSDFGGLSPLHRAAQSGQTQVLAMLIDRGVPMNARSTRMGESLLHLAASEGQLETIDWLLERQIGIDEVDGSNSTPLRVAVARGQTDAARRLIDSGADVDIRPADLVRLAARYADAGLVETLIQNGADVNAYDRPRLFVQDTPLTGPPALYYAVVDQKLDIATVLLEHGAEIDAGPSQFDPLHAAIDTKNTAMVELLLDHGANPNRRIRVTGEGRVSPLERAEREGAADIARLLESRGARY